MKSSLLSQLFFGIAYAQLDLTTLNIGSSATGWPLQAFKTLNGSVPAVRVVKYGQTEQGYLFTTNRNVTNNQCVPYITSDDGQLVWYGGIAPNTLLGLRTQTFNNDTILTYWQGTPAGTGVGYGSIVILDTAYDVAYNVTLKNTPELNFVTILDYEPDTFVDAHESEFTADGSVLVTAINATLGDLSSVGGPSVGWILDSQIVELDVKTNEVLFRWSSLDQSGLPLTASWGPLDNTTGTTKALSWDWAHLNSAAKYGDKYLINSRHLCTVFLVDKNGNVEWHLSGRTGGNFSLDLGTTFCFEHDVRAVSYNDEEWVLTMHNNDNIETSYGTMASTGLSLVLNLKNMTASLNRKLYVTQNQVYAVSQGSYQDVGSSGHVVVGRGAVPRIEEFDGQGNVVMIYEFGTEATSQSYRGYRSAWHATPNTSPAVYACTTSNNETTVYASWNGATEVDSWRVSYGSSAFNLSHTVTYARNGFETRLVVESPETYVQVAAIS
ncbi:hypothetical protein SEUCBS140593_006168, partial [Sporothrix eucalyptigena]